MSEPENQPEENSGKRMIYWVIIVAVVLLLPVIPFVLLGDQFESGLLDRIREPMSREMLAVTLILLLAVDIFLPVPSSMAITYCGGHLGTLLTTLSAWVGLCAGAFLGYFLARYLGRPFAEKMAGRKEMEELSHITSKYGVMTLVWTRALPILAEAAVLFVGATSLPWKTFWKPVVAANLVIAFCYSLAGSVASELNIFPVVVIASGLFPLGLAWLVRKYHRRESSIS